MGIIAKEVALRVTATVISLVILYLIVMLIMRYMPKKPCGCTGAQTQAQPQPGTVATTQTFPQEVSSLFGGLMGVGGDATDFRLS